MTTEKPQPPSFDANAWRHAFQQAADEVKTAWQKINPNLRDVLIALGSEAALDSAPESVDIATARDQVVTAALRYAAAEGDAGTSLADTNAALEVLDDALAGYVDATGWRDKPPTVTAVEALKPGNEVEFTVRATVDHGGLANTPNGNFMGVEFVAEIGRDFRVLKTGEPA